MKSNFPSLLGDPGILLGEIPSLQTLAQHCVSLVLVKVVKIKIIYFYFLKVLFLGLVIKVV